MSAPVLILLALALSVVTAGVSLALGQTLERRCSDPVLRDRGWAALLAAPLLPPLLVGLWLLLPAPVRMIEAAPLTAVAAPLETLTPTVAAAPALAIDFGLLSWALLAIFLLAAGLRMAGLAARAMRLGRLLKGAWAPSDALRDRVERQADRLSVTAPIVAVSDEASEPLLVGGFGGGRLLLPSAFEDGADDLVAAAVIAHELAHLKRGDHRALWLEEGLMIALAFNPLAPTLRRRRDAAREEACDALALSGAAEAERRAYAYRLIEALRDRAGPQPLALTFTGAGRTIAMHRLKAILSPAAPAGRRARLGVAAAGLGLLAAVGAGSWAVAAQRPAEVRVVPPGLSGQQQAALDARYRGLSADGFRTVCASTDPTDQGYCAGVMFAQISNRDAAVCGPDASDGEALATYVETGRAAMLRIDPRADEGAYGYAERVLSQAFPCQGESEVAFNAGAIDFIDEPPEGLAPPPTGGGRLWVRFDSDDMQTYGGDRLVLTLSGQDQNGVRYEHVSEASTGPDGELPDVMFLDLAAGYFPGSGERRAYELTARIQRGDQVVYVSDATTLRLAPGSQGSLARMRPVLEMRPA